MLLEELLKLFLDSRRRGVAGARKKSSDSTLEFYESRLRIFTDWLLDQGLVNYGQVRRLHIVQFLDLCQGKQKEGSWSESYVLQIMRSLRAFFRWIDADEECNEFGLKGMQRYLPKISTTPQRTDIPQNVDIKRFRGSFDMQDKWEFRDYVASSLMLTNGVRNGEVCGLRLQDIHLEEKTMIVTGKGNKTRLVPLTQDMVRLLKIWLKRRSEYPQATNSEYVFVSKRSPKMDPATFAHSFAKHCKRHDLPRITAHTFRHAFSTNYLRQGGDIEKLRTITGHSSYEILRNYLHMAKIGSKEVKAELEKVNLLKEV